MSFDNSPNKLEAAFIQRNETNQYYEEINISASNAVIYLDENGLLTADKISVWAANYGIGTGGGGSSLSSSWASASIQSQYATQSVYATQSISASYALTASVALKAITASYAMNGGGGTTDILNVQVFS